MKIIKHLLRLISLFFILTVVLAVIYFRTVLLPDDINGPIDTALSEIGDKIGMEIPSYKPVADGSIDHGGNQVSGSNGANQESIEQVGPDTDSGEGMVTVITESVTKTVNELFSSNEDKAGDVHEEVKQSETVVSKADKPDEAEFIINDAAKTIESSHEDLGDAVNTSSDAELSDSRKILIHARNAFWHGDMEEAEKAYRELTEHEELATNAYGELGNVYYAQGKWQEAGRAYYEAAERLIELKQTHQVNYLLRVIQGLDSESAEKLKQKISG